MAHGVQYIVRHAIDSAGCSLVVSSQHMYHVGSYFLLHVINERPTAHSSSQVAYIV